MSRWTIQEWKSIRYGDQEGEMPLRVADRIAAVAATSPLAGRGGAGVLEHGRRALRARGVVGVIASGGDALEILPKIDVPEQEGAEADGAVRRRLVHMLAVALDVRIDAGQMTALDWQRETLLEILIRLFSEKLLDTLRHGMPRSYVAHADDLPRLRGRLEPIRQFTTLACEPTRLACRYDELSPDIALNQIMKAAVRRLGRVAIRSENQRRLRELGFAYAEIADVPVAALRWNAVVLDRTNSRWRELLNLARLLLGERFQSTSAGAADGFSLLFEMNTLFEAYVARVLALALADDGLRVVSQGGRLYCLETDRGGLFQTKPDILLKRGGEVVQVIDTKWKRVTARIDDPKQGVSQGDVYQMMAYSRLYGCDRLTLLYPHHVGLGGADGILERSRINPSQSDNDQWLETATIDVASAEGMLARLRSLCTLISN